MTVGDLVNTRTCAFGFFSRRRNNDADAETLEVYCTLCIIHSPSTHYESKNNRERKREREKDPAHSDDTGKSNGIGQVVHTGYRWMS